MAAQHPVRITIEAMTAKDLEEVTRIERGSFPSPWSRRLFEQELTMPFAQALVAREIPPDRVVGYLCFWLVDREAHILNLAVDPERRRRGIGGRLLLKGVDHCREMGVQEITLEVRRSNYPAISLYRNFQFRPRGIRPRYYSDSGEDALIMRLHLGEGA